MRGREHRGDERLAGDEAGPFGSDHRVAGPQRGRARSTGQQVRPRRIEGAPHLVERAGESDHVGAQRFRHLGRVVERAVFGESEAAHHQLQRVDLSDERPLHRIGGSAQLAERSFLHRVVQSQIEVVDVVGDRGQTIDGLRGSIAERERVRDRDAQPHVRRAGWGERLRELDHCQRTVGVVETPHVSAVERGHQRGLLVGTRRAECSGGLRGRRGELPHLVQRVGEHQRRGGVVRADRLRGAREPTGQQHVAACHGCAGGLHEVVERRRLAGVELPHDDAQVVARPTVCLDACHCFGEQRALAHRRDVSSDHLGVDRVRQSHVGQRRVSRRVDHAGVDELIE